jgi:hypothetical protein
VKGNGVAEPTVLCITRYLEEGVRPRSCPASVTRFDVHRPSDVAFPPIADVWPAGRATVTSTSDDIVVFCVSQAECQTLCADVAVMDDAFSTTNQQTALTCGYD